ncbi:hypothetical protein SDC9_197374 [bioreactor metagenome]|uniref:Uncharacterized protein n=1 Tax=bioreactor metagenome TaxID=1076179 RepID=A0A645IFZ5_9ZZZZ
MHSCNRYRVGTVIVNKIGHTVGIRGARRGMENQPADIDLGNRGCDDGGCLLTAARVNKRQR